MSQTINAKTINAANTGKTGAKPRAKKISAPMVRYTVVDAARPGSGSALASYTAAWLGLTGMDETHSVPAKTVRALAGDTAFGYHVRKGNFVRTKDGVTMSAAGFAHFTYETPNRNIRPDPEMIESYSQTLMHGKTNALVKNAAFIKALA